MAAFSCLGWVEHLPAEGDDDVSPKRKRTSVEATVQYDFTSGQVSLVDNASGRLLAQELLAREQFDAMLGKQFRDFQLGGYRVLRPVLLGASANPNQVPDKSRNDPRQAVMTATATPELSVTSSWAWAWDRACRSETSTDNTVPLPCLTAVLEPVRTRSAPAAALSAVPSVPCSGDASNRSSPISSNVAQANTLTAGTSSSSSSVCVITKEFSDKITLWHLMWPGFGLAPFITAGTQLCILENKPGPVSNKARVIVEGQVTESGSIFCSTDGVDYTTPSEWFRAAKQQSNQSGWKTVRLKNNLKINLRMMKTQYVKEIRDQLRQQPTAQHPTAQPKHYRWTNT